VVMVWKLHQGNGQRFPFIRKEQRRKPARTDPHHPFTIAKGLKKDVWEYSTGHILAKWGETGSSASPGPNVQVQQMGFETSNSFSSRNHYTHSSPTRRHTLLSTYPPMQFTTKMKKQGYT